MMKIAAVFIIYHPNVEDLQRNILKTIAYVDKIILWFNSPVDIFIPDLFKSKVVIFNEGQNSFISKPLNKILDYCLKSNIDYLLAMDQDSEWLDLGGFLQKVLNSPIDNAIVYAPNVNGNQKTNKDVVDLDSVITSGSLYHVKNTYKLGGFREDYKIYWVDGEFSFWARKNGYKLVCLTKFLLKHQFGGSTKKILGISGANYSPIVYYFMFRNMLWMHREHGNNAVSYKTILYTIKMFVPGIILCERNKLSKLYQIAKAFVHGFFKPLKRRAI